MNAAMFKATASYVNFRAIFLNPNNGHIGPWQRYLRNSFCVLAEAIFKAKIMPLPSK